MKYVNKETGAVINVDSVIAGGGWLPVTQQTADQQKPVDKEPINTAPDHAPQVKRDNSGLSGSSEFDAITVKEIKQELDANGVKYSKTAKKPELYALMMGK